MQQVEIDRIVLLGGSALLALWRTVAARDTPEGAYECVCVHARDTPEGAYECVCVHARDTPEGAYECVCVHARDTPEGACACVCVCACVAAPRMLCAWQAALWWTATALL